MHDLQNNSGCAKVIGLAIFVFSLSMLAGAGMAVGASIVLKIMGVI